LKRANPAPVRLPLPAYTGQQKASQSATSGVRPPHGTIGPTPLMGLAKAQPPLKRFLPAYRRP
jgi:hypothetical protein